MKTCDLINEETIFFLKERHKNDILNVLVSKAVEQGHIADRTAFKEALDAREAAKSTGIGGGVAIPHAKIAGIKNFFIMTAILDSPVEWASLDPKPVRLVFLIGGPNNDQPVYLHLLGKILGVVKSPEKKAFILGTRNPVDIAGIFE